MDSIVAIDEDSTIRLFNTAAEDLFRCSADEAKGTSFDRFSSESFRETLASCKKDFDRRGTTRRYMCAPDGLLALRADGEQFPVEATISRAETAGRSMFTIILRDINDRIRAEEDLRKLQVENVYLRERCTIGVLMHALRRTPRTDRRFRTVAGDGAACR